MMFNRLKAANAFNIFKWKQHGESSIYTGLLHNVPPEVELSNYGGIPSPGSESPSGFLNGESLNVEPIADLDLFFERLYSYYCNKGLWCIITRWVVELLSLGFTICFSGFFLLYVDWNGLQNAKCGMDAVESGIKPCDLVKEALHEHPLIPFTVSKAIIVGYLALFSLYWIFCFVRFFTQLKDTLSIRDFCYNRLHVTDSEIQTMPWATVLERVVRLQSSQRLCVVKDLSAHDMVMRLMRKENYLIGMLNKGVLAFPISQWVPGAGPKVRYSPNGMQHRLILTKMLEWTLNWCILQSMFDRNFRVRRDFISNPGMLKKQLVVVGLAMLLLSPFLVIFMLVYLFLRHAEQFYNHPSTASSRRWSNLSKWMFREFNEVDHLFKHRINSSVMHASEYLKQFPSPIISIVAKFISLISGGFAAVLIIIAFLEESLLEGHIFGRNLFWYTAVFGAITAISRAAIVDEILVLDPVGTMSAVVQHTHYKPKRWRGKESTEAVRMEFETLFQYTGMMLLEEMASIFLTPILLMFVVPQRVDDILQFIADFTVDIEGVGHVCSFSTFDFQHHGNTKYGSPYNAPDQKSSQGKMEKSFLSFHSSYPSWEPNSQGKEFLSKLRTFQERKLQGLNMRYTRSPTRSWKESPVRRPMHERHVDSLWLIDSEQRDHPYLLDWYYSSRQNDPFDYPVERYPGGNGNADEKAGDFWDLTQKETRINVGYEENRYEDDRVSSGMDAATSQSFFRRSVLQNVLPELGAGNGPARSHWWDRNSRPAAPQPETSFLEPPDFLYRYPSGNFHGNSSEKSTWRGERQEHDFEWGSYSHTRMLSRTMFMEGDEIEGGDEDDDGINPVFGDVYNGRPPKSPTLNVNPLVFGE